MKIAMTALAVAMLAGATSVAAAAPGQHGDREWSGDRPQRDWGGDRPAPHAPRAAEAPRAPVAPRAAEPRRDGGDRGRNVAQGGGRDFRDRGRDDRHDGGRRWDHDGDRGGDRRDSHGRDRDRRGDGHWDRDWRDGRGRHWDHDRDRDRDWDRDRDRHRGGWDRRGGDRWIRGRYPSVYFSQHRYHHRWRPPVGYYVRLWSYGDYLPGGWYGPDWWLGDPWAYGLPLAPPGFDWVRVGDDALLVDQFTGRIVQVVRDVFW